MSAPVRSRRSTISDVKALKGVRPIVSLTAYTAPMATFLDPHVDFLLVGDSLGMVLYGFETTLPVTLDMMIAHGAAVVRGSKRAMVLVDMPFGTYQESPAQAFRNAARVLQETGANGVKMEGGEEMAETVHYLTQRGIPVLGHVGLTRNSSTASAATARRAATRPRPGRSRTTRPPSRPPAPSASCSKAPWSRSRARSPTPRPSPSSASAPRPTATARSW